MSDIVTTLDPAAPVAGAQATARDASGTAGAPIDIVVRADQNGIILFVSPACRAMGYEPQELVGRHATELVHPEDLARFVENTASLFAPNLSGRRANRVHRFRRADGTWVWLQGNPLVLSGHDGRPGDVVNMFRVVEDWA